VKPHCYRRTDGQPYTRKKYIRGDPPSKITRFTHGNPSGNYEYQLSLVAQKEAQVRHNALEAARIAVNRLLQTELTDNYCLRILPYPHHILRENKMIFGAHADRLQDGMRGAFGKPIGVAARVKNGQAIITIEVTEAGIDTSKRSLKLGAAKFPMPCRIEVKSFVK
jgi:large subunit ribosomal protein L10e